MVYGFAKNSKTRPSAQEMEHCIKRNFDGFNEEIKPYEIFLKCFTDDGIYLVAVSIKGSNPAFLLLKI